MNLSDNMSLQGLQEELLSEQKILGEAERSGRAFDTVDEIRLKITHLQQRINELQTHTGGDE